jgi:hypothetical protein
MTIDSKSLTVFFRDQGIYLFIAFVVGAIFWAIGQPINPFTGILYSLCIGNFVSPPVQWLHALYEKPSPYDWLIFLTVLGRDVTGLRAEHRLEVLGRKVDRAIQTPYRSRLCWGTVRASAANRGLSKVWHGSSSQRFQRMVNPSGRDIRMDPARGKIQAARSTPSPTPGPASLQPPRMQSSIEHRTYIGHRYSDLAVGSENSDLLLQLKTRKLVERGKGILQRDLGLSEEEAYLVLGRQSRQKCRPMKEVAQAITLSDEVRRSSLQPE